MLGNGVNEMGLTRSGYLKAMGIDVWTSRSAVAPQEVAAVEAAIEPANSPAEVSRQAPAKKVETDTTVQTGDAATGKQIPEFMLALFHYETIGICLSLRAESELPRRFCDDVARAMGGSIESVRYQCLGTTLASITIRCATWRPCRWEQLVRRHFLRCRP